jgi:hypothetical protein
MCERKGRLVHMQPVQQIGLVQKFRSSLTGYGYTVMHTMEYVSRCQAGYRGVKAKSVHWLGKTICKLIGEA